MYRVLTLALILLLNWVQHPGNETRATAIQLVASKAEYRSSIAGEWEVITKVIWSDCPYVQEGTSSESKITFHDINGTLFPEWSAHDWQLVRDKSIDFNHDMSLHWERESKLVEENQYWFVKSINDFRYNRDKFIGKSVHKQYLNGEFVGSYITKSYLIKSKSLNVS
jgi:hypothetical protein